MKKDVYNSDFRLSMLTRTECFIYKEQNSLKFNLPSSSCQGWNNILFFWCCSSKVYKMADSAIKCS